MKRLNHHPVFMAAKYLLRRILAILLTLIIGVFLVVVIANRKGMIDNVIHKAIEREITVISYHQVIEDVGGTRQKLEDEAGLNLPFFPKHILYTYKALRLDWGEITITSKSPVQYWVKTSVADSRELILSQLPNTLLLTGVSYLLLALIGIPLALYLSQREGHWLDRLMGVLSPISSVPSWVLGVLLVIVFSIELRWFPIGSMDGIMPIETKWERITTVAYHMVLPVSAIVLSMFFNLVYNWRTYLLTNSNEDYVSLGKAQGIHPRRLERLYILRPALPYMLTTIVLTFVGFWQTITALEYFFQWPGIGKLFVDSLPNFLGETMYYGEMVNVLGIVVIFAYFLGATLILLDFAYVLVDPRLRIESANRDLENGRIRSKLNLKEFIRIFKREPKSKSLDLGDTQPVERKKTSSNSFHTRSKHTLVGSSFLSTTWKEIRHEPLALIGFFLVILLISASIVILIKIPYDPVAKDWTRYSLSGKPTTAKLGLPTWVNLFRKSDLPSTIIVDENSPNIVKRYSKDASGNPHVQIDIAFDYPYQEFPSEVALYVTSPYKARKPIMTVTWLTPDNRVFQLKNASIENELTYLFTENISTRKILKENINWQEWFITEGNYPTPAYYLLFADPELEEVRAIPGSYGMRIEAFLFEEDADIDVQLVVFGQVEGLAGTDIFRRDLGIPLFWGLPFALLIGVAGAIVTTIISLLLAATSAWVGGWVDALIQRLIEANLVLPVMAIGVLLYAYYGFNLWFIMGLIILLNIFGAPTKAFRAAFLQIKEAGYVEAASAYGAGDLRIITRYLIPRILPVIIPQIVILIPNFFFLEATLAIFNIFDNRFPTWGRIIYDALRYGATFGSRFWVLEPIALMLVTGLSFVLLGFALNRVLNPQLKNE